MTEARTEIKVKINPRNASSIDDPEILAKYDEGLERARIGNIALLKQQIDEGRLKVATDPSNPLRATPEMAVRSVAQEQAVLEQNVHSALGGLALPGRLNQGEPIRSSYYGVPIEYVPDSDVPFGEYEVVDMTQDEALRRLREAQTSPNSRLHEVWSLIDQGPAVQ